MTLVGFPSQSQARPPMTKILVTGNCQARPLSIFVEGGTGADMLSPVIVHLEQPAAAAATVALIDEADLIFAQLTVDTFPVPHVRSSWIKERYPQKTLIWPNIFYLGQQPFLRYITHIDLGRVMGPLEAYHDLRIYFGWRQSRGLPIPEGLMSVDRISSSSLSALREREGKCDVAVSDLIIREVESERIFFTFNHPTKRLLAKFAERLCALKGLPFRLALDDYKEPLARITPPSILDRGNVTYSWHEVAFEHGGKIKLGARASFDAPRLIELCHASYNAQHRFFEDESRIRYTPDLGSSRSEFAKLSPID